LDAENYKDTQPMLDSVFPPLVIRGQARLPIVQEGMGVGISAHRLASTVAREGAIGTIASVELRRLHPDIMHHTRRCRHHETLTEGNLEALDREIRAARQGAGPEGFIAMFPQNGRP
jgi:nitronate monooxygenase